MIWDRDRKNKIFWIYNFQPAKTEIESKIYWRINQNAKIKIIRITRKPESVNINQNQLKSIKKSHENIQKSNSLSYVTKALEVSTTFNITKTIQY